MELGMLQRDAVTEQCVVVVELSYGAKLHKAASNTKVKLESRESTRSCGPEYTQDAGGVFGP